MILCSGAVVVHAQETKNPAFVGYFDVTQRLEYSDNPDLATNGDSEFFGRTLLGVGLDSQTRTERLSFNLSTDIQEGRNNRPTFDFGNYNATFGYDRQGVNANFGVNFRFSESDDIAFISDEDIAADSDVINQDFGTRRTYGAAIDGAFGLNAPVGGSYRLGYSETKYTDSPLVDRSSLDLSGQLNFRIDPRIVARLTAKYTKFDTDGVGADRETKGIGIGARLDVTPRLVADIDLSYDQIDRSGTITGSVNGLSGVIALTQALPNGTLGASLSSEVSSNTDGRRYFARVTRDMALSETTSLFLTAGATHSSETGTDPLFEVRYAQQRKSARFNLGLSQSVTTDTANAERISTTLRANYNYLINSDSSLGVSFAFFNRNDLSAAPNDGQRVDIGVNYRHQITRDWGLVGGYSHRLSKSDLQADRSSNTVFLGLDRRFSWKP